MNTTDNHSNDYLNPAEIPAGMTSQGTDAPGLPEASSVDVPPPTRSASKELPDDVVTPHPEHTRPEPQKAAEAATKTAQGGTTTGAHGEQAVPKVAKTPVAPEGTWAKSMLDLGDDVEVSVHVFARSKDKEIINIKPRTILAAANRTFMLARSVEKFARFLEEDVVETAKFLFNQRVQSELAERSDAPRPKPEVRAPHLSREPIKLENQNAFKDLPDDAKKSFYKADPDAT
ncbi:MAG: hypothetical protein JWM16_6397 [Verrucomicrobiales bacterium]|nr:hypothetical protein [Verrucomicrobiales bacterium]